MKKKLKSNSELEASTADHYNRFPLEFLTANDEENIEKQQPLPFKHFVETYLKEGFNVCDIGCGPGRAVMYLAQKGLNVVAVDISMNSLLMAQNRYPGGSFILSSNMALPFAEQYFD